MIRVSVRFCTLTGHISATACPLVMITATWLSSSTSRSTTKMLYPTLPGRSMTLSPILLIRRKASLSKPSC